MPADPIEAQKTEDQAFLKECLNELRGFIEEQIQHLTEKIPPEVNDPRP